MILSLFLCLHCSTLLVSQLDPGEEIVFFPTEALRDPSGGWNVTIHGNVHNPSADSTLRKILVDLIRPGDLDSPLEKENYEKRVRLFLVDNLGWKLVRLRIAGRQVEMNVTGSNGHFYSSVHLSEEEVSPFRSRGIIPYESQVADRVFRGESVIISDAGPIIVSDIDDTIKISDARDKKELLRNTFMRVFRATPGMPDFYKSLQSRGSSFYFVSASPWQLYPELAQFARPIYPPGVFRMKNFRLKDSDFMSLFKDPYAYKIETIEPIVRSFPGRQFVLIGDSGEKDPEAYVEIARRYPASVKKIWIRMAYGEEPERISKLKATIAPGILFTFLEPSTLDSAALYARK